MLHVLQDVGNIINGQSVESHEHSFFPYSIRTITQVVDKSPPSVCVEFMALTVWALPLLFATVAPVRARRSAGVGRRPGLLSLLLCLERHGKKQRAIGNCIDYEYELIFAATSLFIFNW